MDNKIFKCECGREFSNAQAFNGHKSHCKTHNIIKYGSLDVMSHRSMQAAKNAAKTRKELLKQKQEEELQT